METAARAHRQTWGTVSALVVEDLPISESVDPEPEVMVDADALWREYRANPFSADTRYLHRQFAVELRPFHITRLPDGSPIFIYRAFGAVRIRALVLDTEIHKIAVLAKEIDSAVVIAGTCDGYLDGVVRLSGCTLVDPANVID